MTFRRIENRDLLATCWTWSGDAAPARGDESSPVDIHTRLKTVEAAGWKGVGFVHGDLAKITRDIGLRELRTLLDDHGIEKVELEFISNWWADGELRRASDAVRAALFAAAPILGVTTIKVGAELQSFGATGGVSRERFAESFDALATDAGRHGLRVAVEPMPMSNIRTIAEGADLVREVGNPHGGLVVDTWHIARGGTSYADMAEVLPMEHVFVVELDDADAEVVGSLWDDTIDRRRNPGDGDLDTAAFVAAIHDAGWRGHWGVEIISEELRALPVAEGVRRVHEATMATLDKAEGLPRVPVGAR
ncbi:sugar phosphate isomerase/epimerase family protein [Streptomyces sp. NBC_01451]|uniref:sugar phosphate isomerase/epimerase family protein n=1 Tax=Streptomyces sp. NBC_01451 TaxID=2903872 RepID=UPI002E349DAD|nr:sugar phosphate isomerase/epimerase family protein [Streptomyces sp. NBC_01451]